MITTFWQGFGISAGLIIAIGAQNAFVLSEGIRGRYCLAVALVCILCDVIFITVGVAGVGRAISTVSSLAQWTAWGGACFLLVYGWRSMYSAVRGGNLDGSDRGINSVTAAILMTLAVTLLNPHFYLDTVVLLGGISSRFAGEDRLLFWAGAVSASTVWFVCLSCGARALAPFFTKPVSWRILNTVVGITMWMIAGSLILHDMHG